MKKEYSKLHERYLTNLTWPNLTFQPSALNSGCDLFQIAFLTVEISFTIFVIIG